MTPETIAKLVEAGVGGLLIIVVLIFVNYMKGERISQTEEREAQAKERKAMMIFIGEQREANNAAQVKTAEIAQDSILKVTRETNASYAPLVDAVKGLTTEIRQLKEQNIVHDTKMDTALKDMSIARSRRDSKTPGEDV